MPKEKLAEIILAYMNRIKKEQGLIDMYFNEHHAKQLADIILKSC